MIKIKHILPVVCVLALVISEVDAQSIMTQNGRSLDVNLGASASNNSNTSSSNVGANMRDLSRRYSNAAVSNYYGGSAMNITLPSESVSNFSRNTVGIGDVISGRQYQARPYYSSSMSSYLFGKPLSNDLSSTASTQLYRAYSNVTNASSVDYNSSVSDYSAAAERYGAELSPSTLTRMTVRFDDQNAGTFVYGHSTAGLADAATGAMRDQYSSLFGYMDYESNSQLNQALVDQALGKDSGAEAGLNVDFQGEQVDDRSSDDSESAEQGRKVSDDVFVSVIMGVGRSTHENEYESLRVSPEQRSDAYTVSAVQIKSMTLKRFGGTRQDNFNRIMRSGDSLMAQQEFYRAAGRYELAANYNSNNPLTVLGSAVAYLGAGECYKSALLLRQVLVMYPDIARVKVDLDFLIGNQLAQTRLEQLKNIINDSGENDVNLLALMAFIRLNSGQLNQARQLAEMLKTMPESSAEIVAFANRISPVTEKSTLDE